MSKCSLRNEHNDNMSNRSVALGLRATLPPSWPCGWLGVTAVRLGIVIDSEPVNSLDEGKGQGTMLVCVLEPVSTDTHGHWFKGQYVVASDSHLRWWFKDGDGQTLASRYRYHCCDGNAMDCPELKKPKGIHFERFRVIGGKELAAKVPGWAFGRSCAKMLNAFLKEKG